MSCPDCAAKDIEIFVRDRARQLDHIGMNELNARFAIQSALLAKAKEALLLASTDLAQDALEDPVGFEKRRIDGFVKLSVFANNKLKAALKLFDSPDAGEGE